MPSADHPTIVLCVACSPVVFDSLNHAFRHSKLHVLSAATRDKGVAICVAEPIAVAVLDGESIRGQECSVAQSLKMVRPSLPIILLEERGRLSNIPEGINAVVPLNAPDQLLRKIEELLNPGGTASRAAG
jgi:DNA-binding response OmpR family regulator